MRIPRANRFLSSSIGLLAALCAFGSTAPAQAQSVPAAANQNHDCASDDSGLTLPAGFCATVFADNIGHARHLVVAPSGVVYVNTWSGVYYGNDTPPRGGFLVALQDKQGAGKAGAVERFGGTPQNGGAGGTGIGIYQGWLYAETGNRIVRYLLSGNSIMPTGSPETVISGLPLTGDHPMHPFIIDSKGSLFVDVATATNSCQAKNRTLKSPGLVPCRELETRGGIWRYDARENNQAFSRAQRFATGIRNAEGFAIDPAGRLFVTQHGRDQLHTNWPDLYKPDQEATLPAEQLLFLKQGGDYGWPECYYDQFVEKLVLAPEYGGDGGKKIGACANRIAPVAAFPAHWAPNAMVYYDKEQFPERYRRGVFIAFHGSWNRAPYPQGGYNVIFQPLAGERADGPCEIFADGFAGRIKSPAGAEHRPSGLAVGPDGSLYVSDDIRGRIYKIVYQGSADSAAAHVTPCPSLTAPAGEITEEAANPPEGTNPDAGAAAAGNLPVPEGATREMVLLGQRIFRGEVAGAACAGCHGGNGEGSPVGPALAGKAKKWFWSDGSYAGIAKTIREGVPQPKQFRSAMPAMGGTQLTPDQVSAVAAFVWSLSHRDQ